MEYQKYTKIYRLFIKWNQKSEIFSILLYRTIFHCTFAINLRQLNSIWSSNLRHIKTSIHSGDSIPHSFTRIRAFRHKRSKRTYSTPIRHAKHASNRINSPFHHFTKRNATRMTVVIKIGHVAGRFFIKWSQSRVRRFRTMWNIGG